jgi:hypothetical protein
MPPPESVPSPVVRRLPRAPARPTVRRPGRLPVRIASIAEAHPSLGRRDLVVTAATVVAMAAVLRGPLVWLAAILLLAAMLVGTLTVLGSRAGEDQSAGALSPGGIAERGIAIESLFLPAVAAVGCLGAIRLVPLGLAVIPAVLAAGLLIDHALAVETRLSASARGTTDADRPLTVVTILLVALLAFTGVAAIVPNGIAGQGPPGAPIAALPIGDLALLALGDALVAGLLGYRAAALGTSSVRESLWAGGSAAATIAVGAAALRAMGIPRLIGPALLMLLLYLWDSLHAATPARRRDPRWIWETIALVGVGAAVAFWNLRLVPSS